MNRREQARQIYIIQLFFDEMTLPLIYKWFSFIDPYTFIIVNIKKSVNSIINLFFEFTDYLFEQTYHFIAVKSSIYIWIADLVVYKSIFEKTYLYNIINLSNIYSVNLENK